LLAVLFPLLYTPEAQLAKLIIVHNKQDQMQH
jgi:hypothetical protein